MLLGIDGSNWQGSIGWADVAAAGVSFAICKASEGVTYADPWFARNWHGMAAAGLVRGSYHFAQPDLAAPEADAAFWLACVQEAGGLLPGDLLALDVEAGSGDVSGWVKACLRTVQAAVGFRPLLYSGGWYMQPHGLTHDAELAEYGLWYASYGAVPQTPPFWPFWAIWQYTCEGSVPGVAGPCDCNIANVESVEQLRLYGLPAPNGFPPGEAAGASRPRPLP